MQQTLLLILFCFTSLLAVGQSSPIQFEAETIDFQKEITEDNGDDFFSFIAKGKITNVSNETINVKWARVFTEGPEEWDSQTCDFNSCWAPVVVSNIDEALELNEPLILAPGDTSNMDVYVNPNFVGGMGTFEIRLSTAENPNDILTTATYNFDLSTVTSVDDFNYNEIRVFPNPTTEYIQMDYTEGVDELVVYNLVGQPVRRFAVQNGVRYDVGDLTDGIYLLSLVNYERGIVKTLRVSKYGLRP
ncbi:MAG: T9SS type A sorting domain-containing protein [Saprospiraceae bacterium]